MSKTTTPERGKRRPRPMSRISPSERLSQMVNELRQGTGAEDLTGELVRLGARRLVQELLEGEVTEALGREPYARRDEGPRGYRNGYKERRLDTAEGRLAVAVPQVRDGEEPFRSSLWPALRKRTEVLERLVVEMYARGLSTRDIEDALADLTDGPGSLLSRSTVSRLSEVLWEEYEAFAGRDLSAYEVVYLFADAVYESLRQQVGLKEGVLATWAILPDGSKVLIHLSLGNKESYEHWLEHFRDLVRRGLRPPLTVTTDGAPGLIKAVEAIWPEAERIRCWMHKMQNVLDKVPDDARPGLKSYLEAVRDAPDYDMGKRMADQVIAHFAHDYPSAMRSFQEDLEASLAHLKLPAVHRKNVRTTNLVERSFEEERRRAKVIPRFRGEKECLKLVFGVLWRASQRWRKVRFSEHERRQLDRYIEQRQRATNQNKPVSTVA
ncbi:MAG: IS256 family transposase [Chloroflexi bacterium]|nr:IS256 family transposase [Chloroflexota bacterium]